MLVAPSQRAWLVDASGRPTMTSEQFAMQEKPYYQLDQADRDPQMLMHTYSITRAPSRLAGVGSGIVDYLDMDTKPRRAWSYTPGQRRVRLAPELAYDTPVASLGGATLFDDHRQLPARQAAGSSQHMQGHTLWHGVFNAVLHGRHLACAEFVNTGQPVWWAGTKMPLRFQRQKREHGSDLQFAGERRGLQLITEPAHRHLKPVIANIKCRQRVDVVPIAKLPVQQTQVDRVEHAQDRAGMSGRPMQIQCVLGGQKVQPPHGAVHTPGTGNGVRSFAVSRPIA